MSFDNQEDPIPRNRHKPEESVAKLRQVDVLVSQGQSVADCVRAIGVTEVTCYRWRQKYGGLKSGQVKRLAASLQHRETARFPRVQAAGPGTLCARHDRADGHATPTSAAARAGVTANHALTFELGQP